MSWDAYNKARKEAKEAAEKAKKIASGKGDKELSKSDKSQIKKAYNNAKTYKWCFAIFAIIAILALVTLPFSDYFQPKINELFYGNTTESGGYEANVSTITDVITNSELQVHYVDVGQGDCIMIDLPDGKNIIIDSGSEAYSSTTSQKVLDYIDNILLDDGEIIDYLIVTHPDSDHIYYMPDILDAYEVATIYRPYTFYVSNGTTSSGITADQKAELQELEEETVAELNAEYNYGITIGSPTASRTNAKSTNVVYNFLSRVYSETYGENYTPATMEFPLAGEQITGEGWTLTFYSPIDPSIMYNSWNNYSCVMVLEYNDTKIAFTGDAEMELEEEILTNENILDLPDVDIMDMGHHGSKTSSSDAFVKALNPEYAIISCGLDNKYEHPNQETLDTLHNNGVDDNHIYITANNGDIVIGFNYTPTEESTTTDGSTTDQSTSEGAVQASTTNDTSSTTGGESASTAEPQKFVLAYSGEKSFIEDLPEPEPEQTEIQWWYVVVAIIVFAGIIFLIVIPSIAKAVKKKK